ncbi:mandelate racemase/muconate lactonizing enzyme family protein [Saccharicrinis sp. 156]|uniref:mandelate racemase/muconate lactonizing enzyme family protein n=1 Tax=Saccharicrinis sp. 156 TaxID=3417574 RepID=UPI003D3316FD
MKIKNIEFFELEMPLAVPYTIAYETVDRTVNIVFKITTTSGLTGWGCAAPDLEVTGETKEDVIHNIKNDIIPILENQSPFQIVKFIHDVKQRLKQASSAIAMLDMALHDLLARKAQLPLYQLLGGYRKSIQTSITIGILPTDETLKQAREFVSRGFSVIKLKGGLNLNEDVEKIIKLREELGKDIVLRFDANQGYSIDESLRFVEQTKSARLEILEQPTCQTKESSMGIISNSIHIPVMADESIKSIKDAFRLASNNLIDMVNIKLMKVGGIIEAQHINSVAKAAGMEVMVGCLDECALGISAGLHFALSRPNIEFADLDGHLDLLNDPFHDLFTLKNGTLYPSQEYGLGKIKL